MLLLLLIAPLTPGVIRVAAIQMPHQLLVMVVLELIFGNELDRGCFEPGIVKWVFHDQPHKRLA